MRVFPFTNAVKKPVKSVFLQGEKIDSFLSAANLFLHFFWG